MLADPGADASVVDTGVPDLEAPDATPLARDPFDHLVIRHFVPALAAARRVAAPFRHWLLADVLPAETIAAVRALPFDVPDMAGLPGRREAINARRSFFGVEQRARYPVCEALARAFQAPATVALLQRTCEAALAGGSLRVEYCQDTDGFWLEPHTDIGAKLFTMLIYLSDGPDAETWGTDLLLPDGTLVGRSPGTFNSGLIFIPAADSWHGFAPRPIMGVRRSLIVNYVRPEWRARHELCFPDSPVRAD
jgi:hypothetical protein